MSSYSYVDIPNDNLNCCICRTPFIEPLKTRTCSHTFCKECILSALSVSTLCPIDRWPLTVDDLTPADPVVRNLVDELPVFCPNRELGCLATPQRQLLSSHLGESCSFTEVVSEDGQHDRQALRNSAKHVDHTSDTKIAVDDRSNDEVSEVSTAPSDCPACMAELPLSHRQTHHLSCPSLVVPCSHASHGCPWTGPRGELESLHLPTCSYEGIKGLLNIFSRKVQALADDNALLRRKVEALEGSVNALTAENEDIKKTLRPWFRPHACEDGPYATTSRFTTEMVPGRPPQHARGHSIHTETTPSGISPSNISAPSGSSNNAHGPSSMSAPLASRPAADDPDFASYFPPPDAGEFGLREGAVWDFDGNVLFSSGVTAGNIDAYPSDHTRSLSSHQLHLYQDSYPYSQPPSSTGGQGPPPVPNSPPHVPSVAPLNLGTSLHRTLLSLRESIVTLSTAVDSLARRQDVALATEAMRTNEEIRSLRVVIHGLRMQMHSIMMDRNAQIVPSSSAARPPSSSEVLPAVPSPSHPAAASWLNFPIGPIPFTGPRFPPHAYPQTQSQGVSGPKL